MSSDLENNTSLAKVLNINDLPPEIFTDILRRVPDYRIYEQPASLAMLLTCRRWNKVVCGTPSLWKIIQLDDTPRCLEILRLSLGRSAECKLHIIAKRAEDLLEKFGSAMEGHFHRVQSLVFNEEHEDDPHTWSDQPPVDFAFITSCVGLRRLELLAGDGLVRRSTTSLELPVLHTLVVTGHVNTFGKRFASLPQLVHLTIIAGGVFRDDIETYVVDKVPMTLVIGWPAMPNLRTLTVEMEDVSDLIPTIDTCPLLLGIHVHDHWGFRRLLRFLSGHGRRARGRALAPHLERLRIWPRYLYNVQIDEEGLDEPPFKIWSPPEKRGIDIVPQLMDIIESRPHLSLGVGVADRESLNRSRSPNGYMADLAWHGQYVPEDFQALIASDARKQVNLDVVFEGDRMDCDEALLRKPTLPEIYHNL